MSEMEFFLRAAARVWVENMDIEDVWSLNGNYCTSGNPFLSFAENAFCQVLDDRARREPPPPAPERRTLNRYMPPRLRTAVLERDGFRCRHCGAEDRLTIDHVHPLSLGGPTELDNLQTLCRPCNSRKGARV